MTTLKEIAARCGCSVATVSKALNAMPDISPETAQRIRELANEMGYIPNAAARTLKTNRSRTIGLMLFLRGDTVWNHDHFSRVAAGIHAEVEAAGYDLAPVTCHKSQRPGQYLDYCRHRNYDGVIVMSGAFSEDGVLELVNSDIPLVTIDYALPHRSAVMTDHVQGMRDLVQYVYARGHRRIAYIFGENSTVSQARLTGFLDTCRQLGVSMPDAYVKPALYRDLVSCSQATRELIALPEPPTCILYPDDYAYVGGMNALMDAGLRIPEDISAAGYDGIPLSRLLRPQLTTVLQDGEAAGRSAGQLILQAIRSPRDFVPEHVMLPGKLIEGGTVKDINA